MGWGGGPFYQPTPVNKRGSRTSSSDWHSADEGWRVERTDIMAKHVDSTATLLEYTSQLSHYMTLSD